MMQIAAVLLLSGLVAQAAPAGPPTATFTTFITDIIAGRIPRNISESMNSQSEGLSRARDAFAQLGTFKRLQYVREDNMQGYRRYHYTAIFQKSSLHVVFVVDSEGTIVGFFPDQSGQQPQQGPPQQGPPQQGPPQQGPPQSPQDPYGPPA
ncbi:MAG TPA: hypothetical protein VHS56_03935 [Candidatus Cybelea sp.]|jgi:hypothetical protein|nr:hypothetical protein [Candidatus Cybelea sp.]